MSTNRDRLYELLPAIYRIRDSDRGEPLRALLRVIAEQVDLVEEDIARLYDNWFIETCEDWVVPYIADLVGYRPVHEAGEPGTGATPQERCRNRILVPRRDVANTIRNRRRKGSLALLEELASDVAGWPARAVEFYRRLAWTQSLNNQHRTRGRTTDLRRQARLDLLDSPFDPFAHTVDVRRINSTLTVGRYNIPSVGLFVWRLRSYAVTKTPACCIEAQGPHCFTFSVLGNDAPLFVNPEPERNATDIAGERNLPVGMRRELLEEHKAELYNVEHSVFIWTGVKKGRSVVLEPVPADRIVATDLSDWFYLPRQGQVAVDPVLGRIAFPARQPPRHGVWVHYHYGFSADIGGGEYDRDVSEPKSHRLYRVGRREPLNTPPSESDRFDTLTEALDRWHQDRPMHAVIEVDDGRVYVEPLQIEFAEGQKSLQLRAANGKRPVIRLLDWQSSGSDALSVSGKDHNSFALDGMLIAGRGLQLNGDLARVVIRHTTLVPGWALDADCEPQRVAEPSLEVFSPGVCVVIEHSILGPIQVNPIAVGETDEPTIGDTPEEVQLRARCAGIGPDYRLDPIRLCITDSIVDATHSDLEAIGAPGCPVAHAVLRIARCTVYGKIQVHGIELGENTIFDGRVTVARRQQGCLRFCYVTSGSRTPPRFMCQPDLAEAAVVEKLRVQASENLRPPPTAANLATAQACERLRVIPQFTARRYGLSGYAQLAVRCAVEITRGADDESEMGVFHDLFQPQREANLRARLDEFVPARANVGVLFAS